LVFENDINNENDIKYTGFSLNISISYIVLYIMVHYRLSDSDNKFYIKLLELGLACANTVFYSDD